jgi:hypothetical protein
MFKNELLKIKQYNEFKMVIIVITSTSFYNIFIFPVFELFNIIHKII